MIADTRQNREKHCIAVLFVADGRAVGSCVESESDSIKFNLISNDLYTYAK